MILFEFPVTPVDYRIQSKSRMSESFARNQELCMLCEEFISQAIYYLGENETQTEIINSLHQACSRLHSFEKQVSSSCLAYVNL